MKSILLSIKPKYVELIANGEKTIEIRKSAPKEVPFKAYIYETKGATEMPWVDEDGHFIYKGRGQVIGEFICDRIEPLTEYDLLYEGHYVEKETRVPTEELLSYKGKNDFLYGWHIYDLKIYDKPKPIMQFYKPCPIEWKNCPGCELYSTYTGCCMNNVDRPPQSYMYVEEV